DIVTMAAFAGAFAGLGVATFDRRAGEQARLWQRVLGLGLGLSALAFGFLSRGLVLGLAAPALGVGLTWLLLRAAGTLGREPFGDYVGALSLLIGSAAAAFGVRLLGEQLSDPDRYFWLLGVSLERARTLPTFDTVLLQLGHALFPWSAVLPLAAARLLVAPTDLSDPERERWLALRTLVLVGPAVAYAGYALLAPVSGVLPFSAVAPLAIVVGLGMQSFDRERAASRAAGMVVGALSVILLSDFLEFPDKALSAFVVRDASMPESFRAASSLMLEVGTLASSALFALALSETNEPAKPAFARADYATWLQTLREQWNGNLLFGLLAVEAALLGFLGIDFLADHAPALRQYFALGGLSRSAARVGWLAIPGFVLAPPLVMAARDSLRALDRLRTRSGGFGLLPTRGVLALLALAAFGLVQSIVYYPKLAAQLSPKQTFSAYRRLARSGEELGMTGSGVGSASYYAGRNVPMFPSATEAFDWLMATTARRWLLIRESDLAILNSQYRERQKPARNLPVLDATSSEVLLISNRLEAREKNQNPFDSMFLESPPRPSHPLDANLGAELDVLGWDVSELDGRSVSRVVPGHPYRFSIFYKIVAPVSGSWETFIHIDGFQRRFNGDHPTLQGKYPLHLLRAGDFVADRYDFALDPNFTPGTYRVYFGLFSGSRRLEIKRGPSNDNRIDAGALTVE
ncbi:MAG TPA: hypothetical protein VGP93_18040, partial [Polyangiaceae bacterium]|nr:hypothetical protein [Polyangiaceae bacterium]